MAGKSDYLEDAVLNHVLRNTALTSPTTVYLALYTAAPSDAGGGTEVTGGSYARQSITFAAPSAGSVTTSLDITFPTATAGWGTVSHFGIFDAVTVGNLLYWGAWSVSKAVGIGDTAKVTTGNLTVTED